MKSEADLMMTADELRLRTQRRRRFTFIIIALIVLGTLAVFVTRPTRNAIKGWQARRHAEKAFTFIEEGNWNEARKEAVAAYQLRSSEPQALRAVARFLSRTRQQQAFDFWDQLAQREPLTRDDSRDEAAVGFSCGELERAAAAIQHLLGNDGKDAAPRDWLLAAQLHLQQSAADKALDSLGKVFTDPAATSREQFQATLLQLQAARGRDAATDSGKQSEAWQRLNRFAQGDDTVALDALVLLAQKQLSDAPIPPSEAGDQDFLSAEELAKRLDSHPLAKAPQKLLAVDLQIQVGLDRREALISGAVEKWKGAENSDLVVLATWLNGKGEFQRNLDVIPLDRAIQSRDLFLQRMDALGALGHWEEIDQLLDSERYPLEPVIQRMYLARTNAQLGQEAAAKNNWQRALQAAADDVSKLMALGEYAEKNGANDVAEAAYTQVTNSAPKLRPAWQGRLRLTYARRDTKNIRDLLAEMLKVWPNDIAIQNDEAYTRLLLLPNNDSSSPELIEIDRLAEALVRQHPTSMPHRTLLALARLKQQRPVAALQVYDNIQVTPAALTPSAVAVHASVLAANDQRDAARKEIAPVQVERLLPEELAATNDFRE